MMIKLAYEENKKKGERVKSASGAEIRSVGSSGCLLGDRRISWEVGRDHDGERWTGRRLTDDIGIV
jgi:hypothetical protein